jgi:hypothetical protein
MKMSTQNMSTDGSQELCFVQESKEQAPFVPMKRNVFTDLEREELKEIFREVMSEYGLIQVDTK